MNYKIGHFVFQDYQKSNSYCYIFLSNPTLSEENLLGRLFALFEIRGERKTAKKMAEFISQAINEFYYKNEKILLEEKPDVLDIETIFEHSLQKINRNFSEFIADNKIKFNNFTFNSLVGVLKNDSLYLSSAGIIRAILFYPQKDNYQLLNILEEEDNESKELNLLKIYHNIIKGKISPNSFLLFANVNFTEYLSKEKIKNVLIALPAISAAAYFKNLLSDVNQHISFAALIIKTNIRPKIIVKESINDNSQNSVDRLIMTENTTERLLSPIGVNLKKYFSFIFKILIYPFNKFSIKLNFKKDTVQKFKIKRKGLIYSLSLLLLAFIRWIIYLIPNTIIFISDIFSGKKKFNKDIFQNSIDAFLNIFSKLKKWFLHLPRTSQVFLITSIIFLTLFSASIVIIKNEKQKKIKVDNCNNLISQVENNINSAQASLLYNDEDKARKNLNKADKLISQLNLLYPQQRNKYAKLRKQINIQFQKLRHIIKIEEPILIKDFSSINKKADIGNFLSIDNSIICFDKNNNSIYTLNTKTKNLQNKKININIGRLSEAVALDKNNLIFFNNKNLYNFNLNKQKLDSINIDMKIDDKPIFSIYNKKLYLLDNKKNQIFKLRKLGLAYINPIAWVKQQGVDLTKSVSISIDGYIYTINSQARILKMLSGFVQDFKQPLVEPMLKYPKKILVLSRKNYIYILENKSKRLVVVNKNGKFINQYILNNVNRIDDFDVQENQKKVYVLSNNKIYGIAEIK